MTSRAKIIAIGDELGIVLPEQLVERLGIEAGDELAVSETPGGVELKSLETAQMRTLRRVARENREVLKRLADS